MLPDFNWLNALKLPTKVIAGLFLFFSLLLLFDHLDIVVLADSGAIGRPAVTVAALLFGCLTFTAFCQFGYELFKVKRKPRLLAERRQVRQDEQKQAQEEEQALALRRLDHLSDHEIGYVADCLRSGSPTFYTYVHSPPVSAMGAKGLLYTPGGNHHTDHYPFCFEDFVWDALLERQAEFIQKDEEIKRIAEEEKRRQRRQRGR